MSLFDQRGQKVTCQFNAASSINQVAVQDPAEFITELWKLETEMRRAVRQGMITREAGADADEANIDKAVVEA